MKALFLTFVLTIFAICPAFADLAYDPELIRLHVLANSDREADQEIKIHVRDAIRQEAAAACEGCTDADEAYLALCDARPILEAAARAEAKRQGFSGDVTVEMGIFAFPDRWYGDTLVPAGDYRAVRVLVGAGEGRNWWCVIYPNLCFVDEACADAANQGEIRYYSSIAKTLSHWFYGEAVS